MRSNSSLFNQAELALASYAELSDGEPSQALLREAGMSLLQAAQFASDYRVSARLDASISGLSATIFENVVTGEIHLSIRGTNDGIDFVTDLVNIGLIGTPYLQPQYLVLRAKVQQWLADGTLPQSFTVTGHSLGGFLAIGIAADFSANVEHAYLYNTPGLGGVLTSGAAAILQVLGITAPLDPARILNVKADAGISPIAGFGIQVAPPIRVVIEDQFFSDIDNPPVTRNHSIQVLTDSLALYATIGRLDTTLTVDGISQILRSSSYQNKLTLEALLDALRFTFLGSTVASGNPTVEGNRELFYRNLYSLQESPAYTAPGNAVTVHALSEQRADALADKAKHDFGHFLAVYQSLPFAIEGATAMLASAHEQLFSEWLSDQSKRSIGATDLAYSDAYLADRAEMLAWKNVYFERDGNVALRSQRLETYQFVDKSIRDETTQTDLTFTVRGTQDSAVSSPGRVIFGGDTGEILLGSDIAAGDRLYAGGGDDMIQGGGGNDHLEGGAGNDVYVWNTGDGFDTIFDSDGIGSLVVDGRLISGGIRVAEDEYLSTGMHALRFEGDLLTGGTLLVNGDLKIEGFANGDFGIVLSEEGNISEVQPTAHLFHGPSFSGSVGFGTSEADHAVTAYLNSIFVAKGGDDLLQVSQGTLGPQLAGGAGQDLLLGGDHESGGSGTLWGDAGQDIIIGGPLGERLVGDFEGFHFFDLEFRGSNFRYAEPSAEGWEHLVAPSGWFFSPHSLVVTDSTVVHFDDYLAALNYVLGIDASTNLHSHYDDYLDGGGGNDWLVGGYGSDVLLGGAGDDILEGDLLSLRFQTEIKDASWREIITGLFGQPGDDHLDGGDGNDRLTDRDGGNDVFFGGRGNDVIQGEDPVSTSVSFTNYLDGGDGNDSLTSSNRSLNGQDVLIGGPGDDVLRVEFGSAYLEGGAGNDTYAVSDRFSSISSNPLPRSLVINDFDQANGSTDRLHVTSMSPVSEFSITRDEANLYLGRGGDVQWITVENWFSGPEYKIEEIALDDVTIPGLDTVYDVAGIEARFATQSAGSDFLWGTDSADQLAGGPGDDSLFGNDGDDILAGNAGDDTLYGGEGGDTYVFHLGDGVDRIVDTGRFGIDAIAFGPGITPDSLSLGLGSLLIRAGDNGDAVHIENFDPENAHGSSSIEVFRFIGGTELTHGELISRGFDIGGTAGEDVLRGTSVSDRFAGGQGSDTYLFGRGSGQDEILDLDVTGLDIDTVRMVGNLSSTDIAVALVGDDLTMSIKDGDDQLSIRWQTDQGYGIERVEFPDGVTWDKAAIEALIGNYANTAPTVANPLIDRTVQKGRSFSFAIPEDTFSDPDLDNSLVLSAALSNNDPLPIWLNFDAATGEFSGIAGRSGIGTVSIRVTATDSAGAVASDEFELGITNREQFGEGPNFHQIVRRWRALRHMSNTFLYECDDGAECAVRLGMVGRGWLDDRDRDDGFGYHASTGALHSIGSLQMFQGLKEGFHQL